MHQVDVYQIQSIEHGVAQRSDREARAQRPIAARDDAGTVIVADTIDEQRAAGGTSSSSRNGSDRTRFIRLPSCVECHRQAAP
jgi:hypothetical protein